MYCHDGCGPDAGRRRTSTDSCKRTHETGGTHNGRTTRLLYPVPGVVKDVMDSVMCSFLPVRVVVSKLATRAVVPSEPRYAAASGAVAFGVPDVQVKCAIWNPRRLGEV